jgi:hypothetical protein
MLKEKDLIVELLHGHNNDYDEEQEIFHGEHKRNTIPVLTEVLNQKDILIYTGTITAGVSIDTYGIGHVIGWLSRNTTDGF